MIRVKRGPEPESLRKNGAAWADELCQERKAFYADLEKYTRGEITVRPKRPEAHKRRYASAPIKTALKRMFATKCCYCESSVDAVAHRHVEHFRPQSIYPSLAYHWTNLLFACERCNSTHKRDRFPLAPDERQSQADFDNPAALNDGDNGLLLDPCRDDPGKHFDYAFSDLGIAGMDVTLICRTRRAEITGDVCGLDREDLSDARRQHLKNIHNAAQGYAIATAIGREDMRAQFLLALRGFVSSQAPYSAMARAYMRTVAEIDLNHLAEE